MPKLLDTLTSQRLFIRDQYVMLDRDIAQHLGLKTFRFNERCKRNNILGDNSHSFQLTEDEFYAWKSHHAMSNAISNAMSIADKQGLRRPPFAFTFSGISQLKTMFNLPAQRYVLDTITQGLNPNKNDDLMIESEPENQLVTYISKDGDVKFDVQYDGDTVWLTQQQIANLFATTQQNISQHLDNIFFDEELSKPSVHKESLFTAEDGKLYKTALYNLDAILSIGYRVRSKIATHFRQWSTKVLKEHVTNGFTIKERASQHQLEKGKAVIDNRIGIFGDVHVHIKNSDVHVGTSSADMTALMPLLDQLIASVSHQHPELEAYLTGLKKKKQWPQLFEQFKEGSFLRSSIDMVSDAKDTVSEIAQLLNL